MFYINGQSRTYAFLATEKVTKNFFSLATSSVVFHCFSWGRYKAVWSYVDSSRCWRMISSRQMARDILKLLPRMARGKSFMMYHESINICRKSVLLVPIRFPFGRQNTCPQCLWESIIPQPNQIDRRSTLSTSPAASYFWKFLYKGARRNQPHVMSIIKHLLEDARYVLLLLQIYYSPFAISSSYAS